MNGELKRVNEGNLVNEGNFCWFIYFLKDLFIFLFLWMHALPACMYSMEIYVDLMHMESRRGCQILRVWGYKCYESLLSC